MNSHVKEWNFRYYVADSIMMLPENKHFTTSLRDILKPRKIDRRTAEEITRDVVENAGITLID